MREINVAILGAAGWMGRVHAMAYANIPFFFPGQPVARVAWAVEASPPARERLGATLPGARTSGDWREAVADPDVDLVDVCLPDNLHHEVARAALLAGKHVYCEKPLANTAAEARELADLAREKGVVTRVGHAFPRNPVHDLAREIIAAGEVGEIQHFRGSQHVDVFGDPGAPFMWRADGDLAPTGIVGDTGSHVFSFMELLVGRVSAVMADAYVTAPERPVVAGHAYGEAARLTGAERMAPVTNPDGVNMLCRFANGARGAVDFSRTATGRKFRQAYEVTGTKGALAYTYDEVNRLRFYSGGDRVGRQGWRAIDVGPENPNYAAFLPLPNFALGYNESKIIEAAEVIRSVATGEAMWPTFESGHHICQIVDAVMESSRGGAWVAIA